jgi:hypothetical protein
MRRAKLSSKLVSRIEKKKVIVILVPASDGLKQVETIRLVWRQRLKLRETENKNENSFFQDSGMCKYKTFDHI